MTVTNAFQAMHNALVHAPREREVLAHLADHPRSHALQIAHALGWDPGTTMQTLDRLQAQQRILVERQFGIVGRRLYSVRPPAQLVDRDALAAEVMRRAEHKRPTEASTIEITLDNHDARYTPDGSAPAGTCDASFPGLTNDLVGPCILRHGHDGPVHQAADRTRWAPTAAPGDNLDTELEQARAERDAAQRELEKSEHARASLRRQRAVLREVVTRRNAARARVRALHRPRDYNGQTICGWCSDYDPSSDSTDSAPVPHPCDTIRALDGPPQPGQPPAQFPVDQLADGHAVDDDEPDQPTASPCACTHDRCPPDCPCHTED